MSIYMGQKPCVVTHYSSLHAIPTSTPYFLSGYSQHDNCTQLDSDVVKPSLITGYNREVVSSV